MVVELIRIMSTQAGQCPVQQPQATFVLISQSCRLGHRCIRQHCIPQGCVVRSSSSWRQLCLGTPGALQIQSKVAHRLTSRLTSRLWIMLVA